MAESAHVTSIDAIAHFRGALRTFEEDALRGLMTIDEQSKRMLQWLEGEAVMLWRQQVRRCYDDVGRTRVALETCRRRSVGSNRPACLEELEAHRAAQRKLHEAQEKIEVVHQWAQKVRQQIDDYRGKAMGLRRALEGDVPRTLALLDRTVASLDAYVDQARNEAKGETPPGSGEQA